MAKTAYLLSFIAILLVGLIQFYPPVSALPTPTTTIKDNLNYSINLVNGVYQNTQLPYKIYFKNNSNLQDSILFVKNNYYIYQDVAGGQLVWNTGGSVSTLGGAVPSNSQNNQIVIDNQNRKVTYPNAYSNMDLTYSLKSNGIKENYHLSYLPSIKAFNYLRFEQSFKFNNTLKICTETTCYTPSGSQDDFNTTGKIYLKDSSNNIVFTLQAPVIAINGVNYSATYQVKGSNAQMKVYSYIPTTLIQSNSIQNASGVYLNLDFDPTILYEWRDEVLYIYDTDDFNPNGFSVKIYDNNSNQISSPNVKWITNATQGQAIMFYPNITNFNQTNKVTFRVNQFDDIKCSSNKLWNYCSGTKLDFTEFESKNIITNKTITPNQKGVTACLLDVTDNWTIFQFAKCALSINSYDVTYTGTIVDLDPTLIVVNTSSANVWNNQTITEPNNITHLAINTSSAPYNSLVAYYSFDSDNISGTGTTAYDFTENNNDGTYNGNAQVNSSCIYDNCSSFDGTGDYINVPDSSVFDMNQITVSAWVKANKYGVALARQVPAGNTQFTLEAGNNYVAFYINAGASTDKAEATNPSIGATGNGQWVHLVGTFNGTNQSIYVNGVLNNSITHAVTLNQIDQPLRIGNSPTPGWNPDFNGSIDEVMIFNTSLDASQIQAIYNNQSARFYSTGTATIKWQNFSNSTENTLNISVSSLENNFGTNISARVGYWNLTNGYDNTNASLVAYYHADGNAIDYSGNGNDGTLTNGTTVNGTGVFNNSFGFDGTDDAINITNPSGIPNGTNPRTFSMWINYSYYTTFEVFASQGPSDGSNPGNGAQLYIGVYDGLTGCTGTISTMGGNKAIVAGTGGGGSNICDNTPMNDGKFHHVVVTHDGTQLAIYIDGQFKSIGTPSYGANTVANMFMIGKSTTSATYYRGSIDEVMIWNKTLSADEIKSLYIKGRVANVGVNWTYTPYQNITQANVNYTFNISQNTTNFIVDILQYSNGSLFYPPLLGQALTEISGFISGNQAPTSSQYSPANNSVSSSALVFLVANQSDTDGNLDYYTERIWQSNGTLVSTNITRITGSTNSTNFSVTLPFEGTYYWSGVANDTAGLTSSETNYTLIYDISTPQNVTFINPTAPNNSVYARTYIEMNVTATDTTLLNITTYVYYSNGTLYWNKTNSTSYAFNNLTGVPDGVWKYNATACDSAGRCNSSETRYISLDGQAPSISLVLPINDNLYNTSNIPLNGTATDAIGISSTWYKVLYSSLGTNSTYIGNTTFTFNTTIPITTSGSYYLIAWANDTSNNINNTGYRFFHVANNGTSSGGGSSTTTTLCPEDIFGYYNPNTPSIKLAGCKK